MKKFAPAIIALLLFGAITAIITVYVRKSTPALAAMDDEQLLIIDPGHGGLDGGAVAHDGTAESEINFAIAGKLHELCRIFGVKSVMTRESVNIDYPPDLDTISAHKVWDQHDRRDFINSFDNPVLISIHQNFYPDARPNGCQVFYADNEMSRYFGKNMHALMLQCLDRDSRRVACPIGKDIYLMNSINCPAILVECGFLSNESETKMLKSPEYQAKIAAVLMSGYLQYGGKYEG